ncbi:MAG: PD-(D/E)XK nuclease family protein [Acidobacteriota bacterium]
MAREIWLAPILSNNRERLLERASEVLATGPAEGLLYLAASRPLLELAAGRLLDGDTVRGVWGSLPVHLFRGFSRFVLATTLEVETGLPLAPRIAIDQEELPVRRSLISQIIKRLAREGRLRAIAPLAHRDGCINTIAKLIGEIQRAAKTQAEFNAIVEARARDLYPTLAQESSGSTAATEHPIPLQIDFDREIGLIYSAYAAALDRFGLTDDDADQLRALEVLRGEVDGRKVSVPWLSDVRLLVVDGFFDFTPVQGEMLRLLIPQIAEVIVNLNRDQRNAEIFRPFERTIDQLKSIADFEVREDAEAQPVAAGLSLLRERLFNSSANEQCAAEAAGLGAQASLPGSSRATPGRQGCLRSQDSPEKSLSISLLDCGNRETEIREIAKEIKRLVLLEGYRPSDVAVVVRERASYEDTIARVFQEERIPCALGRRTALIEVPAVRAALKLFEMLIELNREEGTTAKMSELADLVKSGYFRLSETELDALRERFNQEHEHLLGIAGFLRGPDETNVGNWDADELENVIAFAGGELRADRWLKRARQLTALRPAPDLEKLLATDLEDESDSDDESAAASGEATSAVKRRVERAEPVDVPLPGSERKPRPSREVHPALIAWSALVVERTARLIGGATREAPPLELRDAIMRLLDQLQFAGGVRGSQPGSVADAELPALTLDLRGLEGLRRALAAAARSIEMSEGVVSEGDSVSTIKLTTFLDEAMRCLRAQSLVTSHADPDGLKVLEVTDVRGLRFRAVFIAGLVEGGFPLRASRDWIYPHEERERLKQYGLTLEDISPDTLLKEEHYFYQAACRATERLYLSRSMVLEDGSETVASYYIEELGRAVAPGPITKEVVRGDFDGRTLFDSSRSSELAVMLVRQEERHRHRAQREGNFPEEVIARLMATASERGYLSESARRRIAIERERASRWFGKFDGVISAASLIARLQEQYGADHAFSASELSLYGKCPFKFFAEKVLKLDPRGEAALDLTSLDAGSLLHEALRRFFARHRRERLTDFDRAELRRELGEVADAVFYEHERAVPPLNPQVWQIDKQIRKLLLEQVLDYELTVQEQTRSKDVRPAYFELAFGMRGDAVDPGSTDQSLELRRGSDDPSETVRVRGQIDRVDIANDGTAIAYDYKLSKGAGLDDMQEGRALQLHLYLAALEQLFMPGSAIAGGGYYTMRGGSSRRNQGLYRAVQQAYTAVSKRTSSTLTDEEWNRIRAEMEARVWEFIDGIRAGQFQVDPSAPEATCPHCDFSAVCRYEKFRIRRKEGIGEV